MRDERKYTPYLIPHPTLLSRLITSTNTRAPTTQAHTPSSRRYR